MQGTSSTHIVNPKAQEVFDLYDAGDITGREAFMQVYLIQKAETQASIDAARGKSKQLIFATAGLVLGIAGTLVASGPYLFPKVFGYKSLEACLMDAQTSWAASTCYDMVKQQSKVESVPLTPPAQAAPQTYPLDQLMDLKKPAHADSVGKPWEGIDTRPAAVPLTPALATVALPENGEVVWFDAPKQGVAPLEIRAPAGSHYLVKLVSATSKEEVMTIFVLGGTTVTTKVPVGKYAIKYASGEHWHGYQQYFGVETAFAKADELFDFERKENGYSGYTVTLYKVKNGNLQTSKIAASEF